MKYYIIKLGGSVITGKGDEPSFNEENTFRLARELSPYHSHCILVHGTGNFGKPPALKYGYYQNGILEKENKLVALKIRNSLRSLNHLFIDTLISAGIPAFPLEIFPFFLDGKGQMDFRKLRKRLNVLCRNEIVPVMYGDLIPTQKDGFRVVSSDLITWSLSRMLYPETVIFLSNVDGVYLSEPEGHNPNGFYLTDRLNHRNFGRLYQMGSDDKDVSGGMRRKAEIALQISRYSKTCFIGNGYEVDIIGQVLRGCAVKGTYVG